MLIWKLNIQIKCEASSFLRRKVGAGNINLGNISIESGWDKRQGSRLKREWKVRNGDIGYRQHFIRRLCKWE